MPLTNVQTLDMIIQALYEDKGIFNFCNRNLDGFITQHGAGTIYIPKLPLLEAVTPPATNRKYTGADTDMIPVVMQASVVEYGQEITAKYLNKSGRILQGFVDGSTKAHRKNFDGKVIAAAQADGTQISWKGAKVSFADFAAIHAKFNTLEVDGDDRFVVYPARIEEDFYSDPDIVRAMTKNPEYLEKGIFKILNMWIIPSARVAQVGGKETLAGIWGPGLAFLLDSLMEEAEAYDTTNKRRDIDQFAYYGIKLLATEFAVISTQQ